MKIEEVKKKGKKKKDGNHYKGKWTLKRPKKNKEPKK